MTHSVDLVHDLVRADPQLQPLLDEHLEDHDGEVLPYLLLSDVARWTQGEVARNPDRVEALLMWLERRYDAGDEETKNLVAVGFVEMLPASPDGDPVLALAGPSLRQVADEMGLLQPWTE